MWLFLLKEVLNRFTLLLEVISHWYLTNKFNFLTGRGLANNHEKSIAIGFFIDSYLEERSQRYKNAMKTKTLTLHNRDEKKTILINETHIYIHSLKFE